MTCVFVFGSNLAGRHGKGAALTAKQKYNAEYGVGVGRTGDAYAIPTKDEELKVLPINIIKGHIEDFIGYAYDNPDDRFILTPIGTGYAGYSVNTIRGILDEYVEDYGWPDNIYFTWSWFK